MQNKQNKYTNTRTSKQNCTTTTAAICYNKTCRIKEDSNKHIIEEIVRQVGHLPELYEDAQSERI